MNIFHNAPFHFEGRADLFDAKGKAVQIYDESTGFPYIEQGLLLIIEAGPTIANFTACCVCWQCRQRFKPEPSDCPNCKEVREALMKMEIAKHLLKYMR